MSCPNFHLLGEGLASTPPPHKPISSFSQARLTEKHLPLRPGWPLQYPYCCVPLSHPHPGTRRGVRGLFPYLNVLLASLHARLPPATSLPGGGEIYLCSLGYPGNRRMLLLQGSFLPQPLLWLPFGQDWPGISVSIILCRNLQEIYWKSPRHNKWIYQGQYFYTVNILKLNQISIY